MFNHFIPEKSAEKKDPIKHILVLMLENNSYDRKLGDLTKVKPDLEGINPDLPYANLDNNGKKIFQKPTTAVQVPLDPVHEFQDVKQQLSHENGGFVQNFIANYPNSLDDDRQNVMSFYGYGDLPALHPLGAEFTVCDHWFSSVPGPTWPNRFCALSGTSMGSVKMVNGITDFKNIPELFNQTQTNIFDRLDEKNISWRCYYGDFPISLVLTHNREPHNLVNYHKMNQFYHDAKGPANQFPQFTFIEPRYLGKKQNDDHPPHNTMRAEKLIAKVYNAIRANNELWESSLLIVVYDEHGGFYDHVIPPKAVPPDEHNQEGYDFDQLGLRVPAILISPWAKKPLDHTVFDHTSILKFLIEKWNLGKLGNRTEEANSIGIALDFKGGPRKNCLLRIEIPRNKLISPHPHLEEHDVNANHQLIHAFTDYLENKNKSKTVHDLPTLGNIAWLMDKIGEQLEIAGYTEWGMWFRKEADTHRLSRIHRTLKIVENKLNLFQPKKKEEETNILHKNETISEKNGARLQLLSLNK